MITDEFTCAYTLCVTILRRNEITRKEGACYRCFSSPSPRKVCLLKASSERERDRERDGGSEKITLVKIEENDDEGNREDVEDAERESLRHIKEYMRVFPLVYWYNRTGLSDVVPSFRFSNASQIFFFVPRARLRHFSNLRTKE